MHRVAHLAAEGPHVARVALGQALRLAQQVRPAPQPAGVVAVGAPAVAHQPAGKAVQHVLDQLLAPAGHVIQGDGGSGERPL